MSRKFLEEFLAHHQHLMKTGDIVLTCLHLRSDSSPSSSCPPGEGSPVRSSAWPDSLRDPCFESAVFLQLERVASSQAAVSQPPVSSWGWKDWTHHSYQLNSERVYWPGLQGAVQEGFLQEAASTEAQGGFHCHQ